MIECDLCNELVENPNNAFYKLYKGHPKNRIVLESGNFIVMPSIGQIVEGYLLVLPKKHLSCIGQLSSKLFDELIGIKSILSESLSPMYHPPIYFEHGCLSEDGGGCGIYHAHLHCVPAPATVDFLPILLNDEKLTTRYKIDNIKDLKSLFETGQSYLFYEDRFGNPSAFGAPFLPSQFFRRLFAEQVGTSYWNWREFGRENKLISTLEKLKNLS
jgi:diadenosine tetraphosphate (Ap4A) HIT family hydrolase